MSEDITIVPTSGMDFQTQVLIIRGYVVVSNFGESPVHYMDVVKQLDLSRTQVSGINSFFVGLGFLEFIEKGKYIPTKCALKFYSHHPGNENYRMLSECVSRSELWRCVRSLILIRGNVSKDNTLSEILRISETSVKSRAERSLEWLIQCDLIAIDEDDLVKLSTNDNQ